MTPEEAATVTAAVLVQHLRGPATRALYDARHVIATALRVAIAEEREACARIAERESSVLCRTGRSIARDIRARGQP